MSKKKLTAEEIAERKAAGATRRAAREAAASAPEPEVVPHAPNSPLTEIYKTEEFQREWAELNAAPVDAGEPDPPPARRMSGDEVASMLRQQRREQRLAERGY